ncbi:KRAB domain-containing zinc finger protein [Sarotherodon galilaeus]
MPPKKGPTPEEVEDIKTSLGALCGDVAAVRAQQELLLGLLEEVKQLRLQNAEKDRRIMDLERRVDELEQYTRTNDVVISGIKIKPRLYARAVAGNVGEPSDEETRSVEQQVASFLQSKGIEMDLEHVEACHPLPRRSDRPPAVIMRFVNRKNKVALLKQGRKLKGTDVFINEHLTRKNADIARKARQLKKNGKIQHTWVTNCKIFIKLNGTPEEAKVLIVRNMEDLDKYN